MPITEAFSAHTIRQDLQRLSQSLGQLRLELDTVCRELSGEATPSPAYDAALLPDWLRD
ncbi:hypothetical protein [Rivihabitans pingtungensis]|jgi:hypothetical protein|uniref:hypothetical protein n=1 Tax=Rivihabitans pingtungensis TaxID=1054498 RepID=UPI0023F3DE52|nr:hypothetical protein [Rivihabitans pingtungensis]